MTAATLKRIVESLAFGEDMTTEDDSRENEQ
jgi:hypothetical protein